MTATAASFPEGLCRAFARCGLASSFCSGLIQISLLPASADLLLSLTWVLNLLCLLGNPSLPGFGVFITICRIFSVPENVIAQISL